MEASASRRLLAFVTVFAVMLDISLCCTFTVANSCPYTIWPGTLAGAGTPQLPTTGFRLDPGRSVRIPASPGWSGRIWARTGCEFDPTGAGACQTGDCGGRMECAGAAAQPPATLFEITVGKGTDQDYYDVSLVDGYNLPLVVAPRVPRGGCNVTGCAADLNRGCPKELQVEADGGVVACKSACEVFGLDAYCCSGEFANPNSCKPSVYSTIFKKACPRAYSYAFDDGTSTFTCKASDYTIVFCPYVGMKRPDGFSVGQPPTGQSEHGGPQEVIGQPTTGQSEDDGPQEPTSSGSMLSLNICFLLLFIVCL